MLHKVILILVLSLLHTSVYTEDQPMNNVSITRSIFRIETVPGSTFTGFLIAPKLLSTSFHGISYVDLENIDKINLYQINKLSPLKLKKLVAVSAVYDIAIFETDQPSDHHLVIENSPFPNPNDSLTIRGYPHENFSIIHQIGKVQTWTPYDHIFSFLGTLPHQTSSGANGSPVINQMNKVVGVAVAQISNMHFNTSAKMIDKTIKEQNGTSCDPFPNAKMCIEHEIESVEEQASAQNPSAQMFGIKNITLHRKNVIRRNMFQQFEQDAPEILNPTVFQTFFDPLESKEWDWIQQAAEQKYIPAIYSLNNKFITNNIKDNDIANKLYSLNKELAQKGFPIAQHYLGLMYSRGYGIKQDFDQAFIWAHQSALQGFIFAQNLLALLYKNPQTKQYDLKKSFTWLSKSANDGDPEAQSLLAVYYHDGIGVEKDLEQAQHWYNRAQEHYNNHQ